MEITEAYVVKLSERIVSLTQGNLAGQKQTEKDGFRIAELENANAAQLTRIKELEAKDIRLLNQLTDAKADIAEAKRRRDGAAIVVNQHREALQLMAGVVRALTQGEVGY